MTHFGLKSPESEFLALADRSTDEFAVAFQSLLRAVVSKDQAAVRRARERVATAIGQTMTLADMFGRRRVLLELDFYTRQEPLEFMFAASPIVPNVPFSEAFADLLKRDPRLAQTGAEVANLYQTTHSFALAYSAEMEVTQAVQRFIGSAMKKGVPAPKATTIVQELGDFTRSYAGTVYRTNLTTAYTAGRFQQAQEPGVRTVLPAMERWEVMDSGTRAGRKQDNGENHAAANGLVAATIDPIWRTHSPPAGYGCRGGVRMVPLSELRRRGLLDASGNVIRFEPPGFGNYRPHPNFGKMRPDIRLYGAA